MPEPADTASPPATGAVPDLAFLYVGDPMCSWCWGFAPVLQRLEDRYRIPIRTVVGGLRTGPQAQALDDQLRSFLLHHWEQVAVASGQPFEPRVLDRSGFVYDTEPSCRAVVAMRRLAPQHTLAWFARIQRAFYVEGRDVTDLAVFPALLDGFEVDPQRYVDVLHSTETLEETRRDFARAMGWGVLGFPTLLLQQDGDLAVVTRGFVPWESLEPALTGWLERTYGSSADGLLCELGEPC